MSTAAQTRAEGHYWVRQSNAWEVAHYDPKAAGKGWWTLLGETERYQDSDFTEIDERRIERQP